MPDSKIGIVLNLTPAYPRSQHPADVKAARIADLFQAQSFLDPSVLGTYPQELVEILHEHGLLPDAAEEELELIRDNTVDFLGVNYYQPLRVMVPRFAKHPESPLLPEHFYEPYVMPGRKINRHLESFHLDGFFFPFNTHTILCQYPLNIAVMVWVLKGKKKFRQDGMIQDDYRIDFVKGHLRELHRAIEDGANCKGYLIWTFIDCWSWLNSYKNRYGLVELDLETQERRLKKSGHWFKELSDNNGF